MSVMYCSADYISLCIVSGQSCTVLQNITVLAFSCYVLVFCVNFYCMTLVRHERFSQNQPLLWCSHPAPFGQHTTIPVPIYTSTPIALVQTSPGLLKRHWQQQQQRQRHKLLYAAARVHHVAVSIEHDSHFYIIRFLTFYWPVDSRFVYQIPTLLSFFFFL